MGGNNEYIYTVYCRAFDGDDCFGITSPSSNRTLVSFNLDRSIEIIADNAREARDARPTEDEDPDLQVRGYILVAYIGSPSWVASLNLE